MSTHLSLSNVLCVSVLQDFLTVCCPEAGTNPKTLGVLPTTTVQQLAEQCAARFEQGKRLNEMFHVQQTACMKLLSTEMIKKHSENLLGKKKVIVLHVANFW